MYNRIKIHCFRIFFITIMVLSPLAAFAGNDPSIQGDLRTGIKIAMQALIERNTINDTYRLYDPIKGKLLHLQLVKLHDGIVKKGDYFVSCADFKDAAGNLVDLDFLVLQDGTTMIATQAIIHKANGKKRQYHLEG